MNITVLTENTACRQDLICEHGLSLYIETGDTRILFDTGSTDAYAKNAERLGIDLAAVDFAVLSHGHCDHSGGLAHFLSVNTAAPVYVSPHAFGLHYNAAGEYIGLDPDLAKNPRLIPVEEDRMLREGITLHCCTPGPHPDPIATWGLRRQEAGQLLPEDFRHEQYLTVTDQGRQICFSGCSHRGIQNIVHRFRPDVLVGGFHFMKLDPQSPELDRAARQLLEYPTVYYTGHCTGQAQYARLKQIMGNRLHPISTGIQFTL